MNFSWNEQKDSDIALSLAGICQATSQVEQLAKTGYLKTEQFETAVKSLFVTNPQTTEEVYGSVHNLIDGLETLLNLIENHREQKNADLLRYILGVMHLQKRLAKRSEMLYIIGTRLETAERQSEHFGITHDNVVSNIADIYSDTISKFPYRIQVTGEYSYLQQTRVANQVRVLLLAGIRSAMLWRQNQGSRAQLLIHRNKLVRVAQSLLERAKSTINS